MPKDNKDITNKIIDLCLIYEIKESHSYFELLDNKIKFYQNQIRFLEDTKPFFFQKKKLKEHNKKIEDCEQKIYDTYYKMNEEVEMILKMQNSIKS